MTMAPQSGAGSLPRLHSSPTTHPPDRCTDRTGSVTIRSRLRAVCFILDSRFYRERPLATHSGHSPVLLDDLVGAGEDLIWDGEAESLRGLQVDYQVELGWLLER